MITRDDRLIPGLPLPRANKQIKLCGLEILLAYAANGALPILRDILECCSGCNSAVGIAYFGVILVTAKCANILLHN